MLAYLAFTIGYKNSLGLLRDFCFQRHLLWSQRLNLCVFFNSFVPVLFMAKRYILWSYSKSVWTDK